MGMEKEEMKCEKCGYMNPYWLADWRDIEKEWAHIDDIQFAYEIPLNKLVERNGFMYRATLTTIRRMPIEIFKARGKWSVPYNRLEYWRKPDK
jgi:hypothetical protein